MALTPKENLLITLNGGKPEEIQTYGFGPMPGATEPVANCYFEPEICSGHRFRGGGIDLWGVNWVGNAETANGLIPEPGNFILDDITRWREVIHAPDLSTIDPEEDYRKQLAGWEKWGSTRETSAVTINLHAGYFQDLVSFMGFENAFLAMYEEPDEVYALMDYICDFYCRVLDLYMPVVKPDIVGLMDDAASERSLFMSPQMYEDLFLPFHRRQAKYGVDLGLPVTMHCCGHAEELIDLWLSIGVKGWNPAQPSNDLAGIKKKYGNSLVLQGGWGTNNRLLSADVTDEEIRQSIRDTFEMLAPGGGFCYGGGFLGAIGDTEMRRRSKVLNDEAKYLAKTFYKTHPD